MFLIKSGPLSEPFSGSLEDAISRMCDLVKTHAAQFRITDEHGDTQASGFPGDPALWGADTFEHKGKRYGVACIRYFENLKICPECRSPIPASMIACPTCAFRKCLSNPAGKPRGRKHERIDSGDNFDF
jgi:hypothetical protein